MSLSFPVPPRSRAIRLCDNQAQIRQNPETPVVCRGARAREKLAFLPFPGREVSLNKLEPIRKPGLIHQKTLDKAYVCRL